MKENDIILSWHIGQSAGGHERLDTAPRRVHFFWKRGESLVNSAEFSESELAAEISRREKEGVAVPNEFRAALRAF